jgi:hypothetical protein
MRSAPGFGRVPPGDLERAAARPQAQARTVCADGKAVYDDEQNDKPALVMMNFTRFALVP